MDKKGYVHLLCFSKKIICVIRITDSLIDLLLTHFHSLLMNNSIYHSSQKWNLSGTTNCFREMCAEL